MIRSVVRVYRWKPNDVENLYHDDADFFGLEYWFNDAIEMDDGIRAAASIINDLKDG